MEVTNSMSFFSKVARGPERTTPALASIRSRPPYFSTVRATILATLSSSETFTGMAQARSPSSPATVSARGWFMSAMTTVHPSLYSSPAMPLPKPWAAPVTMATKISGSRSTSSSTSLRSRSI